MAVRRWWVCLAVLAPLLAQAQAEGVLQAPVNSGFEEWAGATPVGWTLNDHPDFTGTAARSADAHSGQAAFTLRAGAKRNGHAYQRWFPVNGQTFLTVSVWVKGRGMGGLMLYTYDAKRIFNGNRPGKSRALTDQYQQVSFAYLADKPEVGHVAVVLTCEGEGAEATFDDVTVQLTPLSELERYVSHPDLAAEVKAGGWTAPPGAGIEVADGPYDAPAMLGKPATIAGDAKPYDAATWWQQSAGGGAVGAVWRGFDGPLFPLLGGFPYELRFRHRAESAASVHFKLRYYDAAGAEVKWLQNTWAYHGVGSLPNGWSAWRETTASVLPVPEVRQARFEVWYAEGSGAIALADLDIRPVATPVAPTDSLNVPVKVTTLKDARPVTLPPVPTREAVRVAIPPAATTRIVTATPTELSVELSSGVTLRGAFEGSNFLGLGEVLLGNLVLHAAEAPPWAPLLQADPPADYTRCTLAAATAGCPGHADGVTLKLQLVPAEGPPDEVLWAIWPERTRLGDLDGVGLGYRYAAQSTTRTLQALTDRTVWGLAGTSTGLTVQTQQTYDLNNVFPLGGEQTLAGGGGLRFVHADPFDFQTGPEGSLVTTFEQPGFVDKSTFASRFGVHVNDRFRLPWGPQLTTGPKRVLFTAARGADAFVAARDASYALCRQAYDLKRDTPLPMVNVSRLQYAPCPESKTELERIAREWVPEFEQLGFKRIYLGPLWEGVVCGPSRLEIAERFGGEPALKTLCTAAHGHGLQVIEWLCPAHLWCQADIFKQYPERELKGANGQPPTSYCWPALRGVDLTGDHWQYFVDSVRGLHERTGLDGLWLDSYCSFTHFITTADPQFPLRQGDALFRLHRELHRMGLVTYVEGCACFGIKSNGLPCRQDDEGPTFPTPETVYDTSPYYGPASAQDEDVYARYLGGDDHYYRYLANKCCPFIYYERVREVPGALERIGRANRDYNAVVAYMDRRVLLPDDQGVLWQYQGKPKVLFAFTAGALRLPGVTLATEVATGRKQPVSGSLKVKAATTYLLQAR
jgi:hypothetical protein